MAVPVSCLLRWRTASVATAVPFLGFAVGFVRSAVSVASLMASFVASSMALAMVFSVAMAFAVPCAVAILWGLDQVHLILATLLHEQLCCIEGFDGEELSKGHLIWLL
mmetsp:Transcript_26856/g.43092  ORF Transcript_26856/g.43092 Transcript_26856/m.43092 type:complete len:108 (-) Transcript_26856:799-1122(-)